MLQEIDKQINSNKVVSTEKITTKDTRYSVVFLKYFLPIVLVIVLRINNFIKNTVLFIILLVLFVLIGTVGCYIDAMEITKNKKNDNK